MSYPILEHDPAKVAFIEPSKVIRPRDMPEACVISFFRDVIEEVATERSAEVLVEKRETTAKIRNRRDEGCLTVEMEAAGLMAVAQFREVPLGQILYAGDDLSGAEWDNRNWQSAFDVRRSLFWLAAEAAISI